MQLQSQVSADYPVEFGSFSHSNNEEIGLSIFDIPDTLAEAIKFNRLIEPTSPILGNSLVTDIKSNSAHPTEILESIQTNYVRLEEELNVSSIAYFNTLIPGLISYNQQVISSTKPTTGQNWTEVEPAAIPVEVLVPLHEVYMSNVDSAHSYQLKYGYPAAKDSAIRLAVKYGNLKASCAAIMPALRPNNYCTKLLPKKLGKLIQLNAVISSAEAAYPRLQHSINGYLQHTYSYLLGHDDLEGLLLTAFNAQEEWLSLARLKSVDMPFLTFVEMEIVNNGYSIRDALLLLCYSTRNMPNIDVQYTMNSSTALMLEVYFWKFKELQNEAVKNHFVDVFPNHEFQANPMLYHYATAAYLAYEVRKAGYTNATAVGLSFLSKSGYKFHKLICGLDPRALNTGMIKHVTELLQRQSSRSGIEAGYYGGVHGVEMARIEGKRTDKRDRFGLDIAAIRSNTFLD